MRTPPTPPLGPDPDTAEWLRLQHTPGLPRRAARALLAHFGSPGAVFEAEPDAVASVAGAGVAAQLAELPADWPALVARCAAWLSGGTAERPRAFVPLGDVAYPPRWLQSPDPPLAVFAAGRIALAARDAVAVVGSRHPTPQGLDHARDFARALAEQGWTVVSGLALGIDAAAHEAALGTDAGTVAVIGCGPDLAYPARHRALYERIAAEGLLLSEFPPGTPPRPAHFPQRNRLIASLARGTLVVEAALQSGSLITARLALEVGADVFAIPGSIHSPQSRGCHALIQQGARLVESAQDVIDELVGPSAAVRAAAAASTGRRGTAAGAGARGTRAARDAGGSTPTSGDLWAEPPTPAARPTASPSPRAAPAAAPEPGDPLLQALGYEPMSLDELSARTGRSAADLGVRLLDLELQGRVRRLPGQRFQRIGAA